jgi:hypothetical protein
VLTLSFVASSQLSNLSRSKLIVNSIIMTTSNLPVNIRHANPDDFPAIGKLNASASGTNHLYQTLFANVDPEAALKWEWIDTAQPRVTSGKDSLLILERSDTREMVEFVWCWQFDRERKPVLASGGGSPEGFDDTLNTKISVARHKWQNDMLDKFGQFMCKFLSSW